MRIVRRLNDKPVVNDLGTLKFAFLYAKTVTLGQTHWPETNRVLLRNRRIGCSLSGIVQFLGKGRNNTETLRQWLVAGYDEIQKYDEKYSEWFAIPQSRKTTSIKPSGTISLLAGATPGIHYPISRFYIRRVRVRPGPITQAYAEAGFPVEQDVVDPNSSVVEIPVDVGPVRTLPSMREQMDLAAMVQRWYADNSVSVTLTFDPKTEGHLIEPALNYAQYHFKSLSFLPSGGKVYAQMPYEKITEDEYKKRVSKLKPIIWTNLRREDRLVEKGCDGAACEIVPIPNTDSNAKAVEVVLPRSV